MQIAKWGCLMVPRPCFDSLERFKLLDPETISNESPAVLSFLYDCPVCSEPLVSYCHVRNYLMLFIGNEGTFSSYRKITEKILLWALLVAEKPLASLSESDMESFFEFSNNPPADWVSSKSVPRFKRQVELSSKNTYLFNPQWRPYVCRVESNLNKQASCLEYEMLSSTMTTLVVGADNFFKHLHNEGIVSANPVSHLRVAGGYFAHGADHQGDKVFTKREWGVLVETMEAMALEDPGCEHTLFLMMSVYHLRLKPVEIDSLSSTWRVCDLVPLNSGDYQLMIDPASHRGVSVVSGEYVKRHLERFRRYKGTHVIPLANDNSPIFHTKKLRPGVSSGYLGVLFRAACKEAVARIKLGAGVVSPGSGLHHASISWLRDTSIAFEAFELTFNEVDSRVHGRKGDPFHEKYFGWHSHK